MGEILIYNAKWYKTYTNIFNNLALILLVQLSRICYLYKKFYMQGYFHTCYCC